jgi:cyclopropane-fatty-acyl-phospholipid synthase
MTWGREVPVPDKIRLDAPEGSPERILARLRKFYPGSWPPSGRSQIVDAARARFSLLKSNNGRKDYIETLNRWGDGTKSLWSLPKLPRSLAAVTRLLPRYFSSKDFRLQIESLRRNDQQRCFIDGIMDHERLFFEKL